MAAPTTTISTGLLLLLLPPAISVTGDFIRTNCNATSDPDVCYSSLSSHAQEVEESLPKLASVAIEVSYASARDIAAYISNLSLKPNYYLTAAALKNCGSDFDTVIDQMKRLSSEILNLNSNSTDSQLHNSNSTDSQLHISYVQTWLSAALTNLGTCANRAGKVVNSDLRDRVVNGKKSTSIALAIINKLSPSTQQQP